MVLLWEPAFFLMGFRMSAGLKLHHAVAPEIANH